MHSQMSEIFATKLRRNLRCVKSFDLSTTISKSVPNHAVKSFAKKIYYNIQCCRAFASMWTWTCQSSQNCVKYSEKQGKIRPGMKGKIRPGMKGKNSAGMKGKNSAGMKGKNSAGMKGKDSAGMKGKKNARCRRRDWQNAKFARKAKKAKSAWIVRTKAR